MTLDDFKGIDWNTLTDEEKRSALLKIWGWSTTDEYGQRHSEVAGQMIPVIRQFVVKPNGQKGASYVYSPYWDEPRWSEEEILALVPNPLTDPGAAHELCEAMMQKYGLCVRFCYFHKTGSNMFACDYHDPEELASATVYAVTLKEAICEAIYRAWQAEAAR